MSPIGMVMFREVRIVVDPDAGFDLRLEGSIDLHWELGTGKATLTARDVEGEIVIPCRVRTVERDDES